MNGFGQEIVYMITTKDFESKNHSVLNQFFPQIIESVCQI